MTETPAPDQDVTELSYEQARDELTQVIASLEQGSPSLQQSLDLWKRGTALADRCEEWLTGARAQLQQAAGADTADQETEA